MSDQTETHVSAEVHHHSELDDSNLVTPSKRSENGFEKSGDSNDYDNGAFANGEQEDSINRLDESIVTSSPLPHGNKSTFFPTSAFDFV